MIYGKHELCVCLVPAHPRLQEPEPCAAFLVDFPEIRECTLQACMDQVGYVVCFVVQRLPVSPAQPYLSGSSVRVAAQY